MSSKLTWENDQYSHIYIFHIFPSTLNASRPSWFSWNVKMFFPCTKKPKWRAFFFTKRIKIRWPSCYIFTFKSILYFLLPKKKWIHWFEETMKKQTLPKFLFTHFPFLTCTAHYQKFPSLVSLESSPWLVRKMKS